MGIPQVGAATPRKLPSLSGRRSCHRTWSPGHRTPGGRYWSNLGALRQKESGSLGSAAASPPGFVVRLKIQPAPVLWPGPGHHLDAWALRSRIVALPPRSPAQRLYRPGWSFRGAPGTHIPPLEGLSQLSVKPPRRDRETRGHASNACQWPLGSPSETAVPAQPPGAVPACSTSSAYLSPGRTPPGRRRQREDSGPLPRAGQRGPVASKPALPLPPQEGMSTPEPATGL